MNKKFVLDLNKIPELENANDAYYIDRNHNVGVLKYIGERPKDFGSWAGHINGKTFNPRTYVALGKNDILETTLYGLGTSAIMFEYEPESFLNNGCFSVLRRKFKYSQGRYIFVPNKQALIDIFANVKDIHDNNEKYVLNTENLFCFKSTESAVALKEEYGRDIIICFDKDTLITKFESAKENYLKKADEYIKTLSDLATCRTNLLGTHTNSVDYYVKLGTLNVGDKFVERIKDEKNVYTIIEIDEYGIIHVENDKVIPPTINVLPFDRVKAAKREIVYGDLRDSLQTINAWLKSVKNSMEKASKATPFDEKRRDNLDKLKFIKANVDFEKSREFYLK